MQDLPRVHWGFTHQTEDMHGPHAQTNTFTHTVTADTHIHTQTQSTEGQSLLFIVVEKKRSFVLQLWDGGVCCFTVSVRNRQDKWATTSQCSSSKPSIYAPSPTHSQSEPGMKVISLTMMETWLDWKTWWQCTWYAILSDVINRWCEVDLPWGGRQSTQVRTAKRNWLWFPR